MDTHPYVTNSTKKIEMNSTVDRNSDDSTAHDDVYISVKDRISLLNKNISKLTNDSPTKGVGNTPICQSSKKRNILNLNQDKIVAPDFGDNCDKSAVPISIFVGTWNCVYQEFMEATALSPNINDPITEHKTYKESSAHWFAHLFNRYGYKSHKHSNRRLKHQVEQLKSKDKGLGTVDESMKSNDGTSAELSNLAHGLLNNDETCENDTSDVQHESESNDGEKPPLLIRASTLQLKPLDIGDDEPLKAWITPGYDIYVIALQETISSSLFSIISKYLARECAHKFTRIELEHYKLSGYGDGAILHTKSTSMAVWIRTKLLEDGTVTVGKSKAFALSILNHSKGVITLQLKILGQIVCIIGGHLPAKFDERQRASNTILNKVAEAYGGCHGVNFKDVFHHVLWTGDFNFRVRNISANEAIALLNDGRRDVLFYNDELYSGKAPIFVDYDFEEGAVNFDPTYKKRDNRDVLDRNMDNWADEEYHTRFGIKWYKGGNTCERVPSWTDRVLKWSTSSLKTCLVIDDSSYKVALPKSKTLLLASDHSPVSCGLMLWPLKSTLVPLQRVNIDRF